MANENVNYTPLDWSRDWDNQSGGVIQATIKKKIEDLSTTIDNSVNEINFYPDSEDDTQLVLQYKTNGSDEVHKFTVPTISKATFVQTFNIDTENVDTVIAYGSSLQIPYTYRIQEDGSYVKGHTGLILYTITNGFNSVTKTTLTYSSRSAVNDSGDFLTIKASDLFPGDNTISFSVVTNVGNSRTKASTASVSVYAVDLWLKFEGDTRLNNLLDIDHPGTINFSLPNLSDYGSVKIKAYYENAPKGTTDTSLFNLTNVINSIENKETLKTLKLSFEAEFCLTGSDTPLVTSNRCVILYITNKANDGNLYIATAFEDANIESSNIIVTVPLYSTKLFTFYTYSTASQTDKTIRLTKDGNTVGTGTLNVIPDAITKVSYMYTFVDAGLVTVDVGLKFSFICDVSTLAATMYSPTDYKLYLTSNSKSAGSKDDTWEYKNITTEFNNFNWTNNGWVEEDNLIALLVNDGASVKINYAPFSVSNYSETATTYPFTISVKYKVKNGSNSTESLISCLSSGIGFDITPNKVRLNINSELSQDIDNDDVHTITFVYYGNNNGLYNNLQAIFIDGVILCITTAGNFINLSTKLFIRASEASLYLYDIKAFTRALSFTEIQGLYCFNQNSQENIVNYINKNNIFNTSTISIGNYGNSVSPDKLPDDSTILMLYSDPSDPTPWKTINSYPKDEDYKGYKHFLKAIKLYVKGYEKHARNFYAVHGTMSAQGTSSMDYPIKNYRIYFNKASDVPTNKDNYTGETKALYLGTTADPLPANISLSYEDIPTATEYDKYKAEKAEYSLFRKVEDEYLYDSAPANRFCLKADYAESSGCHNTGFARLSNMILKSGTLTASNNVISETESTLLPQQRVQADAQDPSWKYDIRANVDGRPIYLFFVNGNEVTYAGRYNMNNDKSNVLVFGFEKVTDYFDNEKVKAEGAVIKELAATSRIDNYYGDAAYDSDASKDPNTVQHYTHLAYKDSNKTKYINPIECWEFSTNDGNPGLAGAFALNPTFVFDNNATWLQTWEYRYPDLDLGKRGSVLYEGGSSKPYLLTLVYNFLWNCNKEAINSANNYRNITTLNTFASNLHLYFNVNSVVKYFVLTHIFAAVDQRIKNCMLAFYCDPYITDAEANESPLHRMRGYWIFYDNDTILGLNNSGNLIIPWDFYETDVSDSLINTAFPQNSKNGLWANLNACFDLYMNNEYTDSAAYSLGKVIVDAYTAIRQVATNAVIELYLDTDQCDYYPDAIHNVDATIKYLDTNALNERQENPDAGLKYLKKETGTRKAHRKLWLKRRLTWLDDIYAHANSKDYYVGLKVTTTAGDVKLHGSVTLSKSDVFRKWRFYNVTEIGQNSATRILPLANPNTVITVNQNEISNSALWKIAGLYGCESIDLSNLEFTADNVTDTLSEAVIRGSFPYLTTFIFRTSDKAPIVFNSPEPIWINWFSNGDMPNLKNIYVCNVRTGDNNVNGALNLSRYSALEVVDLTGTNVDVTLPNTSSLTTLKLYKPSTLELNNKTNLTILLYDAENLANITVTNSSSEVYSSILDTVINCSADVKSQGTINISFGVSEDSRYLINSSQMNQLETLAEMASSFNKLSVSGFVYAPDIVITGRLRETFPYLNISSLESGFVLNLDKLELYEGGSLTITPSHSVTTWKVKVNGLLITNGKALNDSITWSSTNWGLTINAASIEKNTTLLGLSATPYLEVTGISAGDMEYTTDRIYIKYIPITNIKLSCSDEFVNGSTTINVKFEPETHTKSHLLTTDNCKITASRGTVGPASNNVLKLTYVPEDNLTEDATITFKFLGGDDVPTQGGLTSNLDVKVDFFIIDRNTIVNNSEITKPQYLWIYALAANLSTPILYRSNFYNFNISDIASSLNSLTQLYTKQQQDFTHLQYCRASGNSFTIPNEPFSALHTPEGASTINWTTDSTTVYSNFSVTFSKEVTRINIRENFTSLPDQLFDLSKTKIKKIGYFDNINEGEASFQINVPSTVDVKPDKNLFKYPSTLIQLGNITNNDTGPVSCMFNVYDSNSNATLLRPLSRLMLYKLGGLATYIDGKIKLGAVASYVPSTWFFDNNDTERINELLLSFINLVTIGTDISFSDVENIGPLSFYLVNPLFKTNLEFDSTKVKTIGAKAFMQFSNSNDFNFSEVTSIKTQAFAFPTLGTELKITLSEINTIESQAFYSPSATLYGTLIITINRTEEIPNLDSEAFKGSCVIVKVPAGSALYNLLASRVSSNNFKLETITT